MSPEEKIELLSAEVSAIRVRLDAPKEETKPKLATAISVIALVFSLASTGFGAYGNHQEEIRANRRDVRAIVQRLSKLPIENYELLQKVKGTGQGEALSGMINQENILLATQAAELVDRYPDSFTSTEYFAVAFALASSNIIGKVPSFFQRAIASAATSNDYNVAARAYAGYLYAKGDAAEGKRLYAEALNVWQKFPESNSYVVNSTDLVTLMYWSQSEYAAGNRVDARAHLQAARQKLAALSPGPYTDGLKSQVDYIGRVVD